MVRKYSTITHKIVYKCMCAMYKCECFSILESADLPHFGQDDCVDQSFGNITKFMNQGFLLYHESTSENYS